MRATAVVRQEEVPVSNDATGDASVAPLSVRPLDADTWPAFARLVEANNGVWGGCWCMGFHVKVGKGRTPQQNRAEKEQRVREGRTHAALVFDGEDCLGWCQFGRPAELPRIKSRAAYEKGQPVPPDWRIACNYVGKGNRRQGVATSSPPSAGEPWRASPRPPSRYRPASCTTGRCRPTSGWGSLGRGRSASTAGSSRRTSRRSPDPFVGEVTETVTAIGSAARQWPGSRSDVADRNGRIRAS
jgi:hypothetical protein